MNRLSGVDGSLRNTLGGRRNFLRRNGNLLRWARSLLRGSRRATGFATRLRLTRLPGLRSTMSVIHDVRAGAHALVALGYESVVAGESAGIGIWRTFWCGRRFAIGGVGAFLFVVVGVDSSQKLLLDQKVTGRTERLDGRLDLGVLLDEETDGGKADTSVEMTEIVEDTLEVQVEVQVEGDAKVGGSPLGDVLVEGTLAECGSECASEAKGGGEDS